VKVHFAQTMNEFHHLLIMESLGGDQRFRDRFFAQHMAMGYYGIACLMYLVSPRMAYNLSEQVEEHAFHTYDDFLKENEEALKAAPPPAIAVHYYTQGDLFLFDEFQTGSVGAGSVGDVPRRPKIENLYDVFVNVRNDEAGLCKSAWSQPWIL
jgi:ubiquinol oxidase